MLLGLPRENMPDYSEHPLLEMPVLLDGESTGAFIYLSPNKVFDAARHKKCFGLQEDTKISTKMVMR